MLSGISQEKLGEALGLTFQQIQKYEKGSNRISASRLQQISRILDVPVAFFFEGAPDGAARSEFFDSAEASYIPDFLATSEGVNLTKAFTKIQSGVLRRRIVELVEAMADADSASK